MEEKGFLKILVTRVIKASFKDVVLRFQNLRASTEYNILPINVGPITINIEAPETQSVSTNNNNEVQENK
jgi:hypothetical protein